MIDITEQKIETASSVALGFFDGLHLGHMKVIRAALSIFEFPSVVFTFNSKTTLPKLQKSKNILTYEAKMKLLSELGVCYVSAPDFAEIKDYSPEQFVEKILVKRLNAKVVSCGYDFHFGKGGSGNTEKLKQLCGERGIRNIIVPAVSIDGEIVSSTRIRELIACGDIEKANRYLGYDLTYLLDVKKGNKIGHGLGFPTINQVIPDGIIVPKYGVYESRTEIDSIVYPGITNVGVKPTVNSEKNDLNPVMETHIIGFSGNLYDRVIKVNLKRFLREEKKFSSLKELKNQISLDINAVYKNI